MGKLSRSQRQLHHNSASSVSTEEGFPSVNEGNEGDITVRHVRGKGVYLFAKFRNRWYSRQMFSGAGRHTGVKEAQMESPQDNSGLPFFDKQSRRYDLLASDDIFNTEESKKKVELKVNAITVQSGAPTAISDFNTSSFIYDSSGRNLYHAVDDTTMVYEGMNETSFEFSINAITFKSASSGGTTISGSILVGTAEDFFVHVTYNNDDGTLDTKPTILYRKNGSTEDTANNSTSPAHLGTSLTTNAHTSATDFTALQTDNATDTTGATDFAKNFARGDRFRVHVTSVDGGVSNAGYSSYINFVNGMVWGSCLAATGPTAAEFLECFSAGLNATGGKGYDLPTSNASSSYLSQFGARQITADSGEYVFFGYPSVAGSVNSIKDSNGIGVAVNFYPEQRMDLANSASYTEEYIIYVSRNRNVQDEFTIS